MPFYYLQTQNRPANGKFWRYVQAPSISFVGSDRRLCTLTTFLLSHLCRFEAKCNKQKSSKQIQQKCIKHTKKQTNTTGNKETDDGKNYTYIDGDHQL